MKAIEKLIKQAEFGRFGDNWIGVGKMAEAELLEYHRLMPCGHKAHYVVTSDDGTSFCALCELYAGYNKEAFILDNGG
jgi:hypothetical protein